MSNLPERPATLRRAPRPAADEGRDPIDVVTAEAPTAAEPAPVTPEPDVPAVVDPTPGATKAPPAPTVTQQTSRSKPNGDRKTSRQTSNAPAAPAPRQGRRGEPTITFSTRLAPSVIELIDAAVAENGLTQRAVVEEAIRSRWG